MMEKKKRKYLISGILIIVLIIDIILFYFVFLKKDTTKALEYKNEYITFTYMSDYSLREDDSKNISLGKDDNSGQIDIVITELSDEVLERDVGFIIEAAVENFSQENENYAYSYYGEYEIDNYVVKDYLFEDGERQVDLNYIIANGKLILISYTNVNEYFDLYESTVLEIINSLEIY